MGTLTEEQQYIIWDIQVHNRLNWTIMMKTGRGKTHIIIKLLERFHTPTLILCHSLETVQGMADSIIKYSNIKETDIGIITSKKKLNVDAPIVVTTHAGFQKNWESFSWKYPQIIYDECDYNLSFPYRVDYEHCMSTALIMSDAEVIRWLSWTPYRDASGDKAITWIFWDIIAMPGQDQNWYNIIPEIRYHRYNQCYWYIFESRHELRDQIMEDETRTEAQIKYIKENVRDYNLVLMKNISETERMFEKLKWELKNVVLVHWQLKTKELREELAKIERYTRYDQPFTIVATIDKFGRWVDIPVIDTLFLLSPIKFQWTVVQSVWRALRNHPGKDDVIIFDWQDYPLLKKQAMERVRAYKKEYGKDVLLSEVVYGKWN